MTELPDPGAFGAVFEDFLRAMSDVAEHGESDVVRPLREHLGVEPKELPTTAVEFPLTEQANLQLAIDAVLGDAEILGFTTRHAGFGSVAR
jgi:cell division protease FtsH